MVTNQRSWGGRALAAARPRERLLAATALALVLAGCGSGKSLGRPDDRGMMGEARRGSLTVPLPEHVADVAVTEARVPGRPLVVIDPGHGGKDPGAPGVSPGVVEKAVTLALARELRARLARRGRVRVALTRDGDVYRDLEQRAAIARQLGANLFVSLHADSAPNPLARGATVYSLSEVASDAEAARFARAQNSGPEPAGGGAGSVRWLLADVAYRDQMTASAELAARMLVKSAGRVALRPDAHRFAAFQVLRRSETPAVLIEAGYLSNSADEAMLLMAQGRAPIVAALADTIEADIARRETR